MISRNDYWDPAGNDARLHLFMKNDCDLIKGVSCSDALYRRCVEPSTVHNVQLVYIQ